MTENPTHPAPLAETHPLSAKNIRIKINVDTSFHPETLSGSCGAIVRDAHGDFIAAANWVLPHVRDFDSTELTAIRNGMFLAANIGSNNMEIELDCMLVVGSMQLMDDYLGGSNYGV